MAASREIRSGSWVRMHLALTLTDGTPAVSTFGEDPLELVVGDGTLTAGLELLLHGLQAGDERTWHLAAGQGYGPRDDSNSHLLPLADFPAGMALEPGVIVSFSAPDGLEVAGTVLEVLDDQVRMDFNHPLAGRELTFRVQILTVENRA